MIKVVVGLIIQWIFKLGSLRNNMTVKDMIKKTWEESPLLSKIFYVLGLLVVLIMMVFTNLGSRSDTTGIAGAIALFAFIISILFGGLLVSIGLGIKWIYMRLKN